MKLWKIFAVISTGLVLGLAYSYLSQEADLSANLSGHPSDGLPGIGHAILQPASFSEARPRDAAAMATEMQETRQPSNKKVRMRVHFQKRDEGDARPSDPLRFESADFDNRKTPFQEKRIQTPVTLADLVEEEKNKLQQRLPEQAVQRHKRGADWEQEIRDASRTGNAAGDEDGAAGLGGFSKAADQQAASDNEDAGGNDEDKGELDEDSGHEESDEESGEDEDTVEDELPSSRGEALMSSRSRASEEGSDEEAQDEDEEEEVLAEVAGSGRKGSKADPASEEDDEEEDLPYLAQASGNKQGSAAAVREDSLERPRQAGSRESKPLPQRAATRAAQKKPRAGKQKSQIAQKARKGRARTIGKDAEKAAKNKTVTVRPALLGFNLTWGILEGEEELYKQDVASIVAPVQDQGEKAAVVQLTAALAKSRSRAGIVIVTWASAAYLDFLRNWVHHLTLLEVENFLVGAMDSEVAEYLRQQNIPYFDMQAGMYSNIQGHLMKGTKAARMLAFNKIGVAQTLNTFGLDALLCDADVVWLRDPSDYFSGLEEADVLVATDGLGVSNAKDDDGLESPEAALRYQMSTGIVFLRHGRGSRVFLDAWDSALRRNASRTEQQAFNAVARVGVKPLKTHPDNWRVFYGMGRTVTFGILPASGFANGHTYFVQRLYDVMRVSPYAVHMSYVFGGVAAKRNRLREEQIWVDDAEYYDQSRLLTLDIHVPAIPDNFERLKNDYIVELHLKLMQHQLDQLVVGFAMAMALNRTLVMPRLVCFCDRFWSPLERCRAPGAVRLQLPFVCPLDHILRPSHFGDRPDLYGPPIAFREHSFWDHPDTPAELKDNQVDVVVGAKGSAAKRMANQLIIPSNLSERDLWNAIQPHDDIKVLMVKNVTGIFSGFSELSVAEGFWRRMAHITGIWCCTYDGGLPYKMAPRLPTANATL